MELGWKVLNKDLIITQVFIIEFNKYIKLHLRGCKL